MEKWDRIVDSDGNPIKGQELTCDHHRRKMFLLGHIMPIILYSIRARAHTHNDREREERVVHVLWLHLILLH